METLLAGVVYAPHAFQKKSKKGSKTAPADIEKVRARLKVAVELHALRVVEQNEKEESDEKAK